MSPLPTLPLLVDAFIADTAHMTVEEVGAHIRLLVFAWRSPGCCLPDDDARLARMLGLARQGLVPAPQGTPSASMASMEREIRRMGLTPRGAA